MIGQLERRLHGIGIEAELVVADAAGTDERLAFRQHAPPLVRTLERERQGPEDLRPVKADAGTPADLERLLQHLDGRRSLPLREGDPRVHLRPVTRHGMTMVPLTKRAGGIQAYKLLVPAKKGAPDPQSHEGYEWLYVLDGRLRLVLGERDLVLGPGEAAEFDTRVPHWFGAAGEEPVEFLSLFGPQGERMHVRARPARS